MPILFNSFPETLIEANHFDKLLNKMGRKINMIIELQLPSTCLEEFLRKKINIDIFNQSSKNLSSGNKINRSKSSFKKSNFANKFTITTPKNTTDSLVND